MRTFMAGVVLALCAATAPAQAYEIPGKCFEAMATQIAKELELPNFVSRAIDEIVMDMNVRLENTHPPAKAVSRQIAVTHWNASIHLDTLFLDPVDYDVHGHGWNPIKYESRETLATERELLSAHSVLPLASLDAMLPWFAWHGDGTHLEPYAYYPWLDNWEEHTGMTGPGITTSLKLPGNDFQFELALAIEQKRASLHRLIAQRDEARQATIANCES